MFFSNHYAFAVLAARLNCLAVGLPLVPAVRIFSPEPALILARFLCMFAYNPFFAIMLSFSYSLF
jgi:hypothetical protein